MDSDAPKVFQFDQFRFDAGRFALYYDGTVVKSAGSKPLAVLASLLRNANQLVTYDEIIRDVWADNPHGATSTRVNQYASKLQKLFSEHAPNSDYLENVPGRGYIFTGQVTQLSRNSTDLAQGLADDVTIREDLEAPAKTAAGQKAQRVIAVFALFGAVVLAAAFVWYLYPYNDDAEIKRVIKDSQLYESLVLYENPTAFLESELDRYWTPELETNVNYDRGRIREAVKKMIAEGRKYGVESKCEQFDFQSVEIDATNKMAVVKTLEKWFVAVYQADGTLLKNRTIGPYFVNYILRKIDGRWLIEKSTTGRVNRPIPRLKSIEPTTEVKSGKQFLVTAIGQDFEPETILFEVVGPGCPEAKPCKVPNDVLRGQSTLSDTNIQKIPLTLSSGEFKITARNGDSQPSEPVVILVP